MVHTISINAIATTPVFCYHQSKATWKAHQSTRRMLEQLQQGCCQKVMLEAALGLPYSQLACPAADLPFQRQQTLGCPSLPWPAAPVPWQAVQLTTKNELFIDHVRGYLSAFEHCAGESNAEQKDTTILGLIPAPSCISKACLNLHSLRSLCG